jgi:hypothetical protein
LPSAPSSQGSPPQGLYLSVFSDGSDEPGPGKRSTLTIAGLTLSMLQSIAKPGGTLHNNRAGAPTKVCATGGSGMKKT